MCEGRRVPKNTKVRNPVSEDSSDEQIRRSEMARLLEIMLEANQVFRVPSEKCKQMGELFTEQYLKAGDYPQLLRDFVVFSLEFQDHHHRSSRAPSPNKDLELTNLKRSLLANRSQAFRKKPL